MRNYLFSGIASFVLLSYEPPFSINKMHIQSNNFVFVFITALIAKTSVYFDKESLHFDTWRSLPMHVHKIESLKSYSEG